MCAISILLLTVSTDVWAQIHDGHFRVDAGYVSVVRVRQTSAPWSARMDGRFLSTTPASTAPFGRKVTTISQTGGGVSTDNDSQTSIWAEIGYVSAMETVFTGLSYLGSRRTGWRPVVAGGFDLMIAAAGVSNASSQERGVRQTGHYLISVGFIAKSLYNLRFGRQHSRKSRFWTNLVAFNVLVFTGYYLDTLD